MLGMINRQSAKAFIDAVNRKRAKVNKKKKKKTGSTSRDYRGVEGVLEDAQRKK